MKGRRPKVSRAVGGSWEIAMNIEKLLREKRDEILRIAARHGASNVRIFGSVARGEADAQSDVDFLVELERGAEPPRPRGPDDRFGEPFRTQGRRGERARPEAADP